MAYVNQQDDDKLYNQQGGQAQQGTGMQGQPGVGGTYGGDGGVSKNVGADALGGASQKAPADFTKSQNLQGAGNAVIQRNQGAGGAVGQALQQPGQKQLQGTLFGLGQEGDTYATTQRQAVKDAMPTYNSGDVANVGSDQNAYNNIQSALNTTFKPLDPYQTTQNTKIDNPTTTGNYSSLLQQTRGPTYSKGMANLDQTLFSRAPDRQQALNSQYNGFQGQVQDKLAANNALTGTIGNEQASQYGNLKNTITGDLNNANQSVMNQVNARLPGLQQQAVDTRYNQLTDLGKKYNIGMNTNATEDAKSRIVNNFGAANSKYAIPQLGFNNAVNSGEADQLNSLNKLLGLGNTYSSQAYNPAAPAIDETAFRTQLGIGAPVSTTAPLEGALGGPMVSEGQFTSSQNSQKALADQQANAARQAAADRQAAIDNANNNRHTNFKSGT